MRKHLQPFIELFNNGEYSPDSPQILLEVPSAWKSYLEKNPCPKDGVLLWLESQGDDISKSLLLWTLFDNLVYYLEKEGQGTFIAYQVLLTELVYKLRLFQLSLTCPESSPGIVKLNIGKELHNLHKFSCVIRRQENGLRQHVYKKIGDIYKKIGEVLTTLNHLETFTLKHSPFWDSFFLVWEDCCVKTITSILQEEKVSVDHPQKAFGIPLSILSNILLCRRFIYRYELWSRGKRPIVGKTLPSLCLLPLWAASEKKIRDSFRILDTPVEEKVSRLKEALITQTDIQSIDFSRESQEDTYIVTNLDDYNILEDLFHSKDPSKIPGSVILESLFLRTLEKFLQKNNNTLGPYFPPLDAMGLLSTASEINKDVCWHDKVKKFKVAKALRDSLQGTPFAPEFYNIALSYLAMGKVLPGFEELLQDMYSYFYPKESFQIMRPYLDLWMHEYDLLPETKAEEEKQGEEKQEKEKQEKEKQFQIMRPYQGLWMQEYDLLPETKAEEEKQEEEKQVQTSWLKRIQSCGIPPLTGTPSDWFFQLHLTSKLRICFANMNLSQVFELLHELSNTIQDPATPYPDSVLIAGLFVGYQGMESFRKHTDSTQVWKIFLKNAVLFSRKTPLISSFAKYLESLNGVFPSKDISQKNSDFLILLFETISKTVWRATGTHLVMNPTDYLLLPEIFPEEFFTRYPIYVDPRQSIGTLKVVDVSGHDPNYWKQILNLW